MRTRNLLFLHLTHAGANSPSVKLVANALKACKSKGLAYEQQELKLTIEQNELSGKECSSLGVVAQDALKTKLRRSIASLPADSGLCLLMDFNFGFTQQDKDSVTEINEILAKECKVPYLLTITGSGPYHADLADVMKSKFPNFPHTVNGKEIRDKIQSLTDDIKPHAKENKTIGGFFDSQGQKEETNKKSGKRKAEALDSNPENPEAKADSPASKKQRL